MAKFYIQSGQVSYVVTAQDVEGAALWAMHRTIEQSLERAQPGDSCDSHSSDEPGCDDDPTLAAMLNGLARFDEDIKCSQRGWGREDAGTLDTDYIFRQWRQLMNAADYLFGKLG